jgi:membrane-anchored protein YejM (alkaline phosphatase superfamily)
MASQTALSRSKFNGLLLESIDEALSSLGEKAKTATYIYLQTKFNIKKDEIPNRVDVFSEALKRLFGLGAKYLEIMSMQNLYTKLRGNEYVASEHIFSKVTLNDYVRLMRHNFEETKQSEVEIRVFASEHEELQRCM